MLIESRDWEVLFEGQEGEKKKKKRQCVRFYYTAGLGGYSVLGTLGTRVQFIY